MSGYLGQEKSAQGMSVNRSQASWQSYRSTSGITYRSAASRPEEASVDASSNEGLYSSTSDVRTLTKPHQARWSIGQLGDDRGTANRLEILLAHAIGSKNPKSIWRLPERCENIRHVISHREIIHQCDTENFENGDSGHSCQFWHAVLRSSASWLILWGPFNPKKFNEYSDCFVIGCELGCEFLDLDLAIFQVSRIIYNKVDWQATILTIILQD